MQKTRTQLIMGIIEGCKVHEKGAYRYEERTPGSEMDKLCKLIVVEGCIPKIATYFLRDGLVIKSLQSETGVWPLYFRFHPTGTKQKARFASIQKLIEQGTRGYSSEETLQYATHLANAEIDLLIEDDDYFMLLESKLIKGSGIAKLTRTKTPLSIHQLVRQQAAGKLLERDTRKTFIHGTIGAGRFAIKPSAHDLTLLSMVGSTMDDLDNIKDCPWSVLEL